MVSEGSDPTRDVEQAATTDEFPSPAGAKARPYIGLVFCAVAAGAFLLGIGVATATRSSTDEVVIASETVGPDGALVRFDGGDVRVPEGAVSVPMRFVVRRSIVRDRVRVRAEGDPIVVEPGRLVAFSFAPRDVTFKEPVEVTFRLPPGVRNGTVFARTGNEILLLTGTVDQARGTATIEMSDFRFDGEPSARSSPKATPSPSPARASPERTPR
ncbi:MAG: hypothetical protein WD646_03570 [Actinomycetota bacterium]